MPRQATTDRLRVPVRQSRNNFVLQQRLQNQQTACFYVTILHKNSFLAGKHHLKTELYVSYQENKYRKLANDR
jgi:hypothetical protein